MKAGAAALLAVAVLAAGGCTSGSDPEPSHTPTTSATTSAPPPPTPTEALRSLAQAGAKASYRASYTARQQKRPHRATWIVWRTPSRLRVDVVAGDKNATLITTPTAAYACGKSNRDKTCFRVAKGNESIPAVLRLDAQELFSDGLAALARRTDDFRVTAAPLFDPDLDLTCFSIRPDTDAARKAVERGDYCFTDKGVLAAVTYPSGNTVRLDEVAMRTPDAKAFKPYAHPTPLP
jgi:hypothetical protein